MLLDREGSDKSSLAARTLSFGRQLIPAAVLVAIVLTLSYSYDSRIPMLGAGLFAATVTSAVTTKQLYLPLKQPAKVSLSFGAEPGRSTLRCLPLGNTG